MPRKQTPDNILFQEWFYAQPESQRTSIKNIIIDRCEIAPDTFNNWLYGNSGIRTIYKKIINDIACETVFHIESNPYKALSVIVTLIYFSLFTALILITRSTDTTGF